MTRIDFHSNIHDRIAYACRLARKAHAAHHKIILLSRDGDESDTLDQALWDFSAPDFLPHVTANDPLAAVTPIVLIEPDAEDLPHHQLLINLSGDTPLHFARFERIVEIIGRDDREVSSGRERWAFYKQRGYLLKHHVIEGV